jgi:hypothetical protein
MEQTVADSPELRFALITARAWGVSPSRFLGRELVQTTSYFYGLDGRLVTSRTTTEAEWTEDDRRMAMELQDWEATLCPGCQSPLSETTSPENETGYVAGLPVRCHRCTASAKAMKPYEESEVPSALFLPVVLRGTE